MKSVVLTALVTCIFTLWFAWIVTTYFSLNKKQTNLPTYNPTATAPNSSNQVSQAPSTSQSQSEFPIPPMLPQLQQVFIHYRFNTKITSIKQSGEDTIITVDTPLPNLPQLILTKQTGVFKNIVPNTDPKPQPPSVLSVGDSILLTLYYDVKVKIWTIPTIQVVSPK